jgi:putative transposase
MGFSPCMSLPSRHAEPQRVFNGKRTFFVSTQTAMRRRIFQSEDKANLMIETLRALMAEHKFKILDFVIMPDHLHLMLELDQETSIERAMQFIKGRFSHRLKLEFGVVYPVWQRGFTDKQIKNEAEKQAYHAYIRENPEKAGIVQLAGEYPYCFQTLSKMKQIGVGRG